MTDDTDSGPEGPNGLDGRATEEIDHTPTVTCRQCDREWDLDYELEQLAAGNRAVEQFALDHRRHTGHFPDGVTPWIVDCRRCPDGESFLSERPARRWAETHARHTRHGVSLEPPEAEPAVVEPDDHTTPVDPRE